MIPTIRTEMEMVGSSVLTEKIILANFVKKSLAISNMRWYIDNTYNYV